MREIIEIFAAVMAVFGIYTVLDMLRVRILYPRNTREALRAVVVLDENTNLSEAASYAKYLRLERKISPERLIILANDDIIINDAEISCFGEVIYCSKNKEADYDGEHESGREEP